MWHPSNSLTKNHCNIPSYLADKPNIVIICDRYSGEAEVSQRSAQTIPEQINQSLFTPYLVTIAADAWSVTDVTGREGTIDRVLVARFGVEEATFVVAYITIYGTPGENGPLQGYPDMLDAPYTTGGVLCEALAFNKEVCNAYLAYHGLRIVRSQQLHNQAKELSPEEQQQIESTLRLPLFVKPNTGGPSVATTCIEQWDQLATVAVDAHTAVPDVFVEECIADTEMTYGCVILPDEVFALSVTEVVTHDTLSDYDAKHYGKSDEITPARISPELTQRVQETSLTTTHLLDYYGFVRIDFIIGADDIPTLLEINTTPSMTEASSIPQQARTVGLQLSDLIIRTIKSELL